uniref:Uncharacterized protein n=1 Tax=Rhizophora mucronata TaxID=61149 RepID=A0A2P2KUB9_RHIMU
MDLRQCPAKTLTPIFIKNKEKK